MDLQEQEKIQNINTFLPLPIGQKLILKGFKSISEFEIKKLLKCKEIEKEINQPIKTNLLTNFFTQNNIPKEKQNKYYVSHYAPKSAFEYGDYDNWYVHKKRIGSGIFWDDKCYFEIKTKSFECKVRIVSLEQYVESIIPDLVLDNIQDARDIGLGNFHIAYSTLKIPNIYSRIGLVKLGEDYFESLGMW